MVEARYDRVADFYEAGWTDAYGDSVSSSFLELLGSVAELRVLDMACGHGRLTRELARRGAAAIGIDLSQALLERARECEEREPLGVTYIHADASAGAFPNVGRIDAVTCHFGLSDIDDLDGAVRTVAEVLASGGPFVFSILHPCFAGSGTVSGSWPFGGTYYEEGWWLPDGEESSLRRRVGANHRTLSTYFNMLVDHGFRLDAVAEPNPPPEWSDRKTAAARFAVFLVARWTKP